MTKEIVYAKEEQAIREVSEGDDVLPILLLGSHYSVTGDKKCVPLFIDNGAVNAIGLDGGSSTSLVLEGRLTNSPSGGDKDRLLPNAIVF
jgi:hypothetical protein